MGVDPRRHASGSCYHMREAFLPGCFVYINTHGRTEITGTGSQFYYRFLTKLPAQSVSFESV